MLRRRALKTNLRATGDNVRSIRLNNDLNKIIELFNMGDVRELKKFLRSLSLRRMRLLWESAREDSTRVSDELLDVISG
jgi:hypothetical protein